ncbi:sulfotransferase family protein [Roseitranquillus sediminis]|uniref:sulfotransferase family protein n=1 Tax=Roseitranquillus sediminis TaxID=2809051 RepID=UPI001D0C7E6F|nr:sulfotransferase [Roseitranquillus sediminis]MBM9595188.1 sulfotransferase [Roseitranquillus sediminis]
MARPDLGVAWSACAMARAQLRRLMPRVAWHRVFHPLCGADPLTLVRLLARWGPPSRRGALPFAIAAAASLGRLPLTLAESALGAVASGPVQAPIFIIGYPRSGTTHLHNLVAASGRFTTVPPVLAALPWEGRVTAPLIRRFIDPYLPATRIIDAVRLEPDSPTEDEVALANLGPLSYFHAIYFPRDFRRAYQQGLLLDDTRPSEVAARGRALRRFVATMSWRKPRPLLLKNPAYTAQVDWLLRLFPEARIIHIHRDPRDVFASNRRTLRTVLGELALQRVPEDEIEATILETYPRVMERLMGETRDLPAARFADVAFDALVADPLSELRRIWQRLALPDEVESLDLIKRYLGSVADYRQSRNSLPPAEAAAIEHRWAPYLDRFGPA